MSVGFQAESPRSVPAFTAPARSPRAEASNAGSNGYGQLGISGEPNSSTPVDVSGLESGVAQIVAGEPHTCALTTGGGVKCWGYGPFGALGIGAFGQSY